MSSRTGGLKQIQKLAGGKHPDALIRAELLQHSIPGHQIVDLSTDRGGKDPVIFGMCRHTGHMHGYRRGRRFFLQ